MQLGTDFMGIRGSFSLEVSFLKHSDAWGITYYTLFIGGSASVEVYFDFKLFEISLGVGLALSVSADSRNAGTDGETPLNFRVTVRFKVLGSWYSRTRDDHPRQRHVPGRRRTWPAMGARTTRMTRTPPAPTATCAPGARVTPSCSSTSEPSHGAPPGTSPGRSRARPCSSSRSATWTLPGSPTIKVTAFGYSQHVRARESRPRLLRHRRDNVTVDPSVTIPVVLDGGSGDDTIRCRARPPARCRTRPIPRCAPPTARTAPRPSPAASSAAARTTTPSPSPTRRQRSSWRLRQRHPAPDRHGPGDRCNGDDGNDTLIGNITDSQLSVATDNDRCPALPSSTTVAPATTSSPRPRRSSASSVDPGGHRRHWHRPPHPPAHRGRRPATIMSNPSTGVLSHTPRRGDEDSLGHREPVIDAGAGSDQLTLDDITANGSGLANGRDRSRHRRHRRRARCSARPAARTRFADLHGPTAGTRTKVRPLHGDGLRGLDRRRRAGPGRCAHRRRPRRQRHHQRRRRHRRPARADADRRRRQRHPGRFAVRRRPRLRLRRRHRHRRSWARTPSSTTAAPTPSSSPSPPVTSASTTTCSWSAWPWVPTSASARSPRTCWTSSSRAASPAVPGSTTFLIGDFDGTVTVAGAARAANPWTGNATINPGAGNDLIRVELTRSTGLVVHVADSTGSDRARGLGHHRPRRPHRRHRSGANGRTRRVSFSDAGGD